MAFYFLNLYNWKTQNPPFSDMPQALINLLETIFFTNQPIWELLGIFFTAEQRDD